MKILKQYVLILVFACCLFYIYISGEELSQHLYSALHVIIGESSKNTKSILYYTTWNVEQYWSHLTPEKLPKYLEKIKCSVTTCDITYDKEKLPIASAVLFHANDLRTDEIYSPENLLTYHQNLKQRWIWVNQESPANIDHAHLYNGLFNSTATYYRNSDIVIPYGHYVKKNYKVTRRQRNYKTTARNLVRKKKGLIAWCVSDCGRLREKYVLNLQKYVNITVFGNCKDRFRNRGTCLKGTKECSKLVSQFKFYLAFENSICQDYIIEKYWDNALQHESVPIVFGANYDSTVAIPSSFINIRQFDSVANLAKFILYLDRNDEEYMKYFA
eukprot:Seg4604.3 transcript_id=Seg4604.3/GoldUCD/mRNA.D3Y31 product="hypothetical protein" protein_id=Seg4604.3/GoldUCD/D3Y31